MTLTMLMAQMVTTTSLTLVRVREIREELNVSIAVGDGLPASEFVYESGTVVLHPFWAKIGNGEIRLNEHVEGKWVQVSALEELRLAPADVPIARGLVSE